MPREDYIIREIQRINEFLLALMGKFQKKEMKQEEFSNALNEALPIDLDSFLKIPSEELNDILVYEKGFNAANIELLADTISKLDSAAAKKRAFELYKLSAEIDRTFSLDRDYKMQLLVNELKG